MSLMAINAPLLPRSQGSQASQTVALQDKGPRHRQLAKRESIWMVSIFLNASIACICYERGLIPSNSPAFQTRRIADLFDTRFPFHALAYDRFLDPEGAWSNDQNSQAFKIFVREKNPKVDAILTLLDGLFQAMYPGYLKAVQFILSDTKQPSQVFEHYTFSITYVDQIEFRSVSQVQLTDGVRSAFLTVGARKSFKKAISGVIRVLRELPDLPRRRSLGLNLFYTDKCPEHYEPDGFISSHRQPITLPESCVQNECKGSVVAANFDTGYYNVNVSAVHMDLKTDQDDETVSGDTDHVGASLHAEDKETSKSLRQMQRSSSELGSHLEPTATDVIQSSMTIPRPTPAPEGSNSTFTIFRRQRNLKPAKMAELVIHATAKNIFNAEVTGPSQPGGKPQLIFNGELLNQTIIARLDLTTRQVNCECKSIEDDGNTMLLCHLCGTLQHEICYGFQGVKAMKWPEEHFCYGCVLLPKESMLNNEMPGLVRLRLALTYIRALESMPVFGSDPEFDSRFMKHLHLDPAQFDSYQSVLEELEARGFIESTVVNNKFMINKSLKMAMDGNEVYDPLDPVAKIGHHYEPRKDNEDADARRRRIQVAVQDYAGDRAYGKLGDNRPSMFDELWVKDSFGRVFPRWGFYPGVKVPEIERPKRALPATDEPTPKRLRTTGRKMSMSEKWINLDESSVASSHTHTDGETRNEEKDGNELGAESIRSESFS